MIKIITSPITVTELKTEAEKVFGEMVKGVVDISECVIAINGELHADEEAVLLQQGSKQSDLWGINLYPDLFGENDFLEFDSMINLRPSSGNNTRGVEDPGIRDQIKKIVSQLVINK